MRTLGRIAAGVVALAAAMFALVVIVTPWLFTFGWIAAPTSQLSGLKVADDATLSVAGATMLLALFTALLALYTSGSVSDGRKERLVSERAMEASWRPILVDVPLGLYVQSSSIMSFDQGRVMVNRLGRAPDEYLHAVVPFRNIGSGPAIITSAGLQVGDLVRSEADISSPITPPGELTRISFDLPFGRKDTAALIEAFSKEESDRPAWRVLVVYGDQSGTNQWRTEAHIAPEDERAWVVRQIALYDGRSGHLIVMSGPRQAHP